MSDPQSLIMTPGVEFSANSDIFQPLPNDAMVDPHSAAWVGDLLQANAAVPANVNIEQYSPPIFIVGANQPTVQILAAPRPSDPTFASWGAGPLGAQLSAVPLPSDFKPSAGTDHEAIIFQPSTGKYWEVWLAAKTGAMTTDSAGNVVPQWQAGWGGYISNLATNSGSFNGGFGTAASGLPLLAGLMTIAEQQAGVINHSIHISIPQALANVFVGAAMRTDGGSIDPNAIPEGATFRLPADLNLDSMVMDPYTRMIAKAVQKYGMVVSDTNGSGVDFYAENPDGRYAVDPYYGPTGILHTTSTDPNNSTNWGAASALLAAFPWNKLEAVTTDTSGLAVHGPTTTIESSGSTSLVQVGNNFYLNSSSYGFGPELKYGGAVFVAGQLGAWAPIGAERTATGYEVALKVTGADQYTFWNTDSNGNYTSNITGVVSGANPVVEFLESSFHQDLNGDGVTGIPGISLPPGATVIEAFGSTNLTEVNNNFYVYSNTTGSGPELKISGAPVVAGQMGGWTPIGAEQTATGYEVAWKVAGTDQYSVWNTDSNGNYVSNIGSSVMSGTSPTLESLENSFHQDLNGDGVIGIPVATVIEAFGSTNLTEVNGSFYLYSNTTGSGPELKYGGAVFVAGQLGGWTPIGTEQTATGYEVALKVTGADQYTVWNTDANGNYVSNAIGAVSGTSSALEFFENSFHQDLNGDGVIGIPGAKVIESFGSTSLVEVGYNFFLNSNSSGSGPELKLGGAAVVAGQLGGWTPIGAEQTATGYEVAWKVPGADQYSVWNTDSNGNYVSNIGSSVMSGTSSTLESLEATFYQDLNGDGVIDLPTTVIDATGNNVVTLNPLHQAAVIEAGATLELAGADSGSVTFKGSTGTLMLDHSSTFTGEIFGLTGNGNLSSSDQIDLKDIAFAAGTTTTSFTGNSTGGTLTIHDAQNHTANILLAGNFTTSTFSLADDGHGGTIVVDPPVKQDLASGTLSFSDPEFTSTQMVSVSPHNGGSGYIGNFTVDAANTANGQDTVGWHFNLDSSSISHVVAQSYDVTVADDHASSTNGTASQTVSVTVGGPDNNSFIFHPGIGADIIANVKSTDTIELNGFSSVANATQLATLLNDAQTGQSKSLFQPANDGHDTVINLGNHDSITLAHVQLADLRASNFIIN
jgi:20S proteasome alpha/beta subunit